MLIATIILMSLGLISLVLFLYFRVKKQRMVAVLLKTTTSLLFVATAMCGGFAANAGVLYHPIAIFIVLGLVCGMLGDIWLDLKFIFPDKDKVLTNAGFISFLVGHLVFIAGFIVEYLSQAFFLYTLLPILGGFAIGVLPIVLQKLLKVKFGDMTVIVYLYSSVLFMMTLFGLSLCIYSGWTLPNIFIFAGGVLFTVSDLILSGTFFGVGKDKPFDIISNHVTYYFAQYFIAFSLMLLAL